MALAPSALSPALPHSISASYDGSHPVFRLLRATGWGPELMNLGYYTWGWGIQRQFDFIFRTPAHAQRQLVLNVLDLLKVSPQCRVLDIACGRGGAAHMIKEVTSAREVCGVDLLEENVALAKLLFPPIPGLSFRQGNAQDLPFSEASFERVLCCEAAFHFPDRNAFVREAARVLAPGGRFVIVDFVWRGLAQRQLKDHPQMKIVRDIWQWDDMFTADEYHAAAQSAGLKLTAERDWTSSVTAQLQKRTDLVLWMTRKPWRKRLLSYLEPMLNSISDAEWQAVQVSADAHRFAQTLTQYKVFVFEKPA